MAVPFAPPAPTYLYIHYRRKEYMTFVDYPTAVDKYIDFCNTPQSGIGTGYSLDDVCGKMSTGEMGLVWARSSAGKSTVLLNFIANTPEIPTVFFNMEMTSRTLAEWLTTMSVDLGVPYYLLRELIQHGADDARYSSVMEKLDKAKQYNAPAVWFVEARSPSVDDFARIVDNITVETGIRPVRILVDHLSLMANARDYENVSRTGAELHQWAQDDDLAVLVAQQTGRSGGENGQRNDGHMPVTLSSGLYAGEHDADWIYGVWRPERDPKYRKTQSEFKSNDTFHQTKAEYDRIKGLSRLAVIKNRPNGILCEEGIDIWFDSATRKLIEY